MLGPDLGLESNQGQRVFSLALVSGSIQGQSDFPLVLDLESRGGRGVLSLALSPYTVGVA